MIPLRIWLALLVIYPYSPVAQSKHKANNVKPQMNFLMYLRHFSAGNCLKIPHSALNYGPADLPEVTGVVTS